MAAAALVLCSGKDAYGPKMFDSSVEIWLVAAATHALTLIMW